MSRSYYDEGYERCDCFWGVAPGSFVRLLLHNIGSVSGLTVLDAGCGEGKNAAFLAKKGALVDAVDTSRVAIRNGQREWKGLSEIRWSVADIREFPFRPEGYDIVIAYGLLHCLPDRQAVTSVLERLQQATRPGGANVICAFNDRGHDLRGAHGEFRTCLMSHAEYRAAYDTWKIVAESDADLTESHPHDAVVHKHSMTRLIARRVSQ